MRRRHWPLLAVLVLTLAAPAAVAATGSGEHAGRAPLRGANPTTHPRRGHLTIFPPVQRPQLALRTAFSVFRTPPDPQPPAIAASLEAFAYAPPTQGTGKTMLGLNPKLAQLARGSTEQGPSFWVIPGRGFLQVLVVPDPNAGVAYGSSGPTRGALREGVAAGQGANGGRSPEIHWTGLVPDGVFAVRLGPDIFARVKGNVYETDGRSTELYEHFRLIRRDRDHAIASLDGR